MLGPIFSDGVGPHLSRISLSTQSEPFWFIPARGKPAAVRWRGTELAPAAYHSFRGNDSVQLSCRRFLTRSGRCSAPFWPTSCALFLPCSASHGEWVPCWFWWVWEKAF